MAMKLIKKEEITENGVIYIVETYQSDETGKESVVKYQKPSDITVEPVTQEPSQLDRIESMVAKSQEEIAQEARDAYTLELIEGGVIA